MANVTTFAELRAAFTSLDANIYLENDITVTIFTSINYKTEISGAAGVSLFWAGPTSTNRYMFVLGAQGDLTINSIIMDSEGRNGGFVKINGGKFTVNGDSILRNIASTTATNAIRIADYGTTYGGEIILNSGLITNVNTSDTIFNYGGVIYMYNNATIDNNQSAGISMSDVSSGQIRPKLYMGGIATISSCQSSQGSSGGIFLGSDIVMGLEEGDNPKITQNRSDVYMLGGIYLTSNSTLTMRYNSEISYNHSAVMGGGLGIAYGSTLTMYDNSVIKGNTSGGQAGGVIIAGATTILNDNASIIDNEAVSNGGGVELQSGARLELRGNSKITGNKSNNGAGVYMTSAAQTSILIMEGDSPSIEGNTALNNGGGIYSGDGSDIILNSVSTIDNNTALNGKGIYKLGNLYLSGTVKILDGLYMNENVPIIENALTSDASIKLESSDYVSVAGVPLVIGVKGDNYQILDEVDRAPWVIPDEFQGGYKVILNEDKTKVLIVIAEYKINYTNLHGSTHDNPTSYTPSDLPIVLKAPKARTDYHFVGWRNEAGVIVTELVSPSSGDRILRAIWEEIYIYFECTSNSLCTNPKPIRITNERMVLPRTIPCRPCYQFIAWNIPDSGTGNVYFPGDVITTNSESITLTAQWRLITL